MVHSLASSPTAGSSGAGMSVHLVFHLPFPALGSLPVSRSPQGLCSGLALGSCPCHSRPPLPPMVLRSCSSRPFLRLSSLLSLPRYLCWVDRDLRLSKFVTNFLLFADTLSLRMKRRGDGSREGSSTGVSSPGPEGGGAGGRGVEEHPWPCPVGPPPLSSDGNRKWLWDWGGTQSGKARLWGTVCTFVTSSQCRCGQRHQPVHASPWRADEEWGQKVREEFLPKKGASLSTQTWPFPPQRSYGVPRDSVPLGCNPSMLLAQKYPAPSRLPLCPAGDGEPAVR